MRADSLHFTIISSFRFLCAAGFAAAFIATTGCKHSDSPSANASSITKQEVVVQAESMTVEQQSWPSIVRTQGTLIADEVTTVGTKIPGRVVEVMIDLGDRVTEGTPIVKLDRQEYELQVVQAEAQLAQARSAVGLKPEDRFEALNPDNAPPVREARAIYNEAQQNVVRIRQLAQQNAISATDLEAAESLERVAEAKLASAQNAVREKIALVRVQMAMLEMANQRLVDSVTDAPFDGMVQNRMVSPGTYVQTGQALATIVRTNVLRFRGSVPERYAQRLAIGQEVRLELEDNDEPRIVKITRISPVIDLQNRSLTFEAIVENNDNGLRTGLFAEADIVLDDKNRAVAIPSKSIIRFAGVDKVWKIIDGRCKDIQVQLGRQNGDLVEVIKGVVEGDTILVDATKGRGGRFEPISEKTTKALDESKSTDVSLLPSSK